jgi:type I restriction enzyme M protein
MAVENFSVVKTFKELKTGGYSFNPGGYFDIKIERSEMTQEEFNEIISEYKGSLREMFMKAEKLDKTIIKNFSELIYE